MSIKMMLKARSIQLPIKYTFYNNPSYYLHNLAPETPSIIRKMLINILYFVAQTFSLCPYLHRQNEN